MKPSWRTYTVIPTVLVMAGAMSGWATQYMTLEEAQKLCFPEGTEFVPSEITLSSEQIKAIEKDSGVRVRLNKQKVWQVKNENNFLGWFIQDEVLGKHEFINWTLALNSDGSVRHIEILDYRETYGYEIREAKWREQFYGKKYGAPLKLDEDIKNISGATLSCKHITDGVKRLLSFYEFILKK
jgi:Na+-transporting NADH:ubiquinone oxidoreductase subunit NqrC